VNSKLNGRFCDLLVNKNIRTYNHRKQDYINLMLCNDLYLRRIAGDINSGASIKKVDQFQAVIMQESFGRILASVTEYLIDVEIIDRYNQFSHMYGNKHLDEKTKAMLTYKSDSSKSFQNIRYWRINMHVLKRSEQYNTIVSFNDLKFFYETQVFDFFDQNPNIPIPNLVDLLNDYLKYIFMYRTPLGMQVYWRFPIYRKPIDMGNQPIVNTRQLKLNQIYEMIKFYQRLQERIDEFNDQITQEDNLPLSLNSQKKKSLKKGPPTLSLRPKFIVETSLPLFNDMNILTVAYTEQEIVLQRPKYLDGVM
jgi:hypothetical protein